MNDQASSPGLDLQFLPDWLKDTGVSNPYANHEGPREERPRHQDGGMRGREGRGAPRSSQGERSGPRPGGERRGSPGGRSGKSDNRPGARREGGDRDRNARPQTQAAPVIPAQVAVEFIPEPHCLNKIAEEIRATHHTYAVFPLARLFLQDAARYRVKISVKENAPTLFRCGEEGPLAVSRESLERSAFAAFKDRFYREETIEKEPPKGNFSNVARCTLSGTLLGPTNHHAYQPTLRALFEKRFSRRMSFADYMRSIEVSNAPETVEQWKESVRRTVTWTTLEGEPPLVFERPEAVQAHFQEHIFPGLLQEVRSAEISGPDSVLIREKSLAFAIRDAWFVENKFPGNVVRHLSNAFTSAGLHLFKHRKRFLYVSTVRPAAFVGDLASARQGVRDILTTIEGQPGIQKKELADKLHVAITDEEARHAARLALASDLRWLVTAGHVIEFQDGKLDLPVSGKARESVPASPVHKSAGPSLPKKPATPAPVAAEPAPAEPIAAETATAEPVAAAEPAAAEPVATEPVATEPVATEPVATEPVATEPVADEPAANEAEPVSKSSEIS